MTQPMQASSQRKIQVILSIVVIVIAALFLARSNLSEKKSEIKTQTISGYISQIQDNAITVTSKHWDNEGNLVEENKRIFVQPDTLFEVLSIDYNRGAVSKGPKLSFQDLKLGEGVEVEYKPKLNESESVDEDKVLREASHVIIYTR